MTIGTRKWLRLAALRTVRSLLPRKYSWYSFLSENAVARLVEALLYKPDGRGFDPSWCLWIFYPSNRTMTLGSTQPLTERSTRSISWG